VDGRGDIHAKFCSHNMKGGEQIGNPGVEERIIVKTVTPSPLKIKTTSMSSPTPFFVTLLEAPQWVRK
jgi:hypothetical protein